MNGVIQIALLAILFLNSCQSYPAIKGEGFIQVIGRTYDSSSRQYTKEDFMPNMKIWYKGNFVIEEIRIIKIHSDNRGTDKKETPVAYYLFIDRTTKGFYHYSSFSDTARILDSYTLADTSEMRGLGGWGFYKNWDVTIVGEKKFLTDTILNGNNYKRVLLNVKEGNSILPTVRYLRCDKKETLFKFNKSLSEEFGCPIVRIDYLPTTENPRPSSSEIVFVRDSLLKEEKKVFDVWERNMKKYPVK
jgi:hypothetical protein